MNAYRTAWERHRDARAEAYEAARDDAITHGGLGTELRLADIDGGLALGYASRSRTGGVRHTLTLTFVERRAEPPPVPLRGRVVRLAVSAAQIYGRELGTSRLVLRYPDRDLDMTQKTAPSRRLKTRIRETRCVGRLHDIPAPSREVARARARAKPGLFESLSPEARRLWDSYAGPENHGPPL